MYAKTGTDNSVVLWQRTILLARHDPLIAIHYGTKLHTAWRWQMYRPTLWLSAQTLTSQIARSVGSTWGPSGADRTIGENRQWKHTASHAFLVDHSCSTALSPYMDLLRCLGTMKAISHLLSPQDITRFRITTKHVRLEAYNLAADNLTKHKWTSQL